VAVGTTSGAYVLSQVPTISRQITVQDGYVVAGAVNSALLSTQIPGAPISSAARWVATPDTSAHVSGDAVDIAPSDSAAWLSEHGAAYGLCQIYGNEPWHYELRPDAVDHGCRPRTPTLRTTPGCSGEHEVLRCASRCFAPGSDPASLLHHHGADAVQERGNSGIVPPRCC
jgi:hypothetical protein